MMKALQIYCHDAYGCMLWDLGSSEAESFFKCWNTNVKLINGLPRNTYTYLVEGHFGKHFVSLRNQVFMRYAGLFRSLLNSPSKEVQMLAWDLLSRKLNWNYLLPMVRQDCYLACQYSLFQMGRSGAWDYLIICCLSGMIELLGELMPVT